jgi:hypothetical protein
MAITCGAVALAISFWFEEQEERKAATLEVQAELGPGTKSR